MYVSLVLFGEFVSEHDTQQVIAFNILTSSTLHINILCNFALYTMLSTNCPLYTHTYTHTQASSNRTSPIPNPRKKLYPCTWPANAKLCILTKLTGLRVSKQKTKHHELHTLSLILKWRQTFKCLHFNTHKKMAGNISCSSTLAMDNKSRPRIQSVACHLVGIDGGS